MKVRHLRCFVGIAEALSFTKTAKKLHIARTRMWFFGRSCQPWRRTASVAWKGENPAAPLKAYVEIVEHVDRRDPLINGTAAGEVAGALL